MRSPRQQPVQVARPSHEASPSHASHCCASTAAHASLRRFAEDYYTFGTTARLNACSQHHYSNSPTTTSFPPVASHLSSFSSKSSNPISRSTSTTKTSDLSHLNPPITTCSVPSSQQQWIHISSSRPATLSSGQSHPPVTSTKLHIRPADSKLQTNSLSLTNSSMPSRTSSEPVEPLPIPELPKAIDRGKSEPISFCSATASALETVPTVQKYKVSGFSLVAAQVSADSVLFHSGITATPTKDSRPAKATTEPSNESATSQAATIVSTAKTRPSVESKRQTTLPFSTDSTTLNTKKSPVTLGVRERAIERRGTRDIGTGVDVLAGLLQERCCVTSGRQRRRRNRSLYSFRTGRNSESTDQEQDRGCEHNQATEKVIKSEHEDETAAELSLLMDKGCDLDGKRDVAFMPYIT